METIAEATRIPIKNVFYMLLYAWDKVEELDILDVTVEENTDLLDLLTRALVKGFYRLKRRGLDRGYVLHTAEQSCLRGKLDITASLKTQSFIRGRAVCHYDELSYNILHNRIIKTTIANIMKTDTLSQKNRDDILDIYRFLRDVDVIPLSHRSFGMVQLHSNNNFYGFLLKICELIYENLIPEKGPGSLAFRNFIENEKQMNLIFENFVRNFYAIEQSEFSVFREEIKWAFEPLTPNAGEFIPKMHTDISLLSPTRKIIIDTKFYSRTFQEYYGKKTIHSGNLYQMFSYLKNLEAKVGIHNRSCEGILLYPTIREDVDLIYGFDGHKFSIKTINLDTNWTNIKTNLLDILKIKTRDTVDQATKVS